MIKGNPFSAEHPAPPERFAGRTQQKEEFISFLDDTIGGNSKNLAVLGEWGIGKTSLLGIEIPNPKSKIQILPNKSQ
ncbi:MAG: ATP-binding protein [Thermoplasmata archaeon]|nr:ATP-binding protein [Thermoplasmata archaeon]